jgi:hypothetical protein
VVRFERVVFNSFQKKKTPGIAKKCKRLKKSDSSPDIARVVSRRRSGGALPYALRVRERVPPPFASLTHETNTFLTRNPAP